MVDRVDRVDREISSLFHSIISIQDFERKKETAEPQASGLSASALMISRIKKYRTLTSWLIAWINSGARESNVIDGVRRFGSTAPDRLGDPSESEAAFDARVI